MIIKNKSLYWHKHFALLPTYVGNNLVWFETIYRRAWPVCRPGDRFYPIWQYKLNLDGVDKEDIWNDELSNHN